MSSHNEILNLLQRNAANNDNSGSTAGARPRRRVVKRAAGARKRKVGASAIGGRKRKVGVRKRVVHSMAAGRRKVGVRRKAGGVRSHPKSVTHRTGRMAHQYPHNIVRYGDQGIEEYAGYLGGEYIGGCEHCMRQGSMCHHCMKGHGMYLGGKSVQFEEGMLRGELDELKEELDHLRDEVYELKCGY